MKAYCEIDQALETSTLTPWKESVLNMVKEKKIKKPKQEIHLKQTKPMLCKIKLMWNHI